MNMLGLVQLCDSAPASPTSFASHLPRPIPDKPDKLRSLVADQLAATIAPLGGVASGIAFRAARQGDLGPLPDLCSVLSSDRFPVDLRLSSVHMGQRLWSVSRTWSWTKPMHDQLDELAATTDLHHAVAFGILVSETTSSQLRAIATYLFNIARQFVNTLIDLVPLDESTGHHLLADLQPTITTLAATCANKSPTDISRLTP